MGDAKATPIEFAAIGAGQIVGRGNTTGAGIHAPQAQGAVPSLNAPLFRLFIARFRWRGVNRAPHRLGHRPIVQTLGVIETHQPGFKHVCIGH